MSTIIGLSHTHYAIILTDVAPTASAAGSVTVAEPVRIPGAIAANLNPNATTATLFADDGAFDSAATQGEITLELNTADLTMAQQAVLLGHKITGGILRRKNGDTPPYLAFGYKTLKSNGKYRYTWNLKGKFALPEQNNQTKGDTVEFNTPTITGAFVSREADGEWQIQIDEDDPGFTPAIGAAWFTKATLETLAASVVPDPPPGG